MDISKLQTKPGNVECSRGKHTRARGLGTERDRCLLSHGQGWPLPWWYLSRHLGSREGFSEGRLSSVAGSECEGECGT